MLKGIFHAHTNASPDCGLTPEAIIERCIDEGVDLLTVTDHNAIEGALALKARAPFLVIVGEEVRTAEGGEIIGLFLTEKISRDLPALEVIAAIRAQGGLVYLPHPFDTTRRTAWPPGVVEPLLPVADIIETFNARNIVAAENAQARDAAERLGKASCAGADAHMLFEYGRTVMFLPPVAGAGGLLESLRHATAVEVPAPWWATARRRWTRLWT